MTNTPLKRIIFLLMVAFTAVNLLIALLHPVSLEDCHCDLCEIVVFICTPIFCLYWLVFLCYKYLFTLVGWVKTGNLPKVENLNKEEQQELEVVKNKKAILFFKATLYYALRVILSVVGAGILCIFVNLAVVAAGGRVGSTAGGIALIAGAIGTWRLTGVFRKWFLPEPVAEENSSTSENIH